MAKRGRKIGARPINQTIVYVGERLRYFRQLKGISQQKLGDEFDLTFQQIQKYERGLNRISAGLLWDMAEFLKVPVTEFYPVPGKKTPHIIPEARKAAKLMSKLSEQEMDVLLKALKIIKI